MARTKYVHRAFELVGNPPLVLDKLGTGWPSIGRLITAGKWASVACHVSRVGSHSRKPHEFRFQNPANRTPVQDKEGFPLFVGVAETDPPLLVLADGRSRVGRKARFSILFDRTILEEAKEKGISTYVSSKGERIFAVRPKLMPTAFHLINCGIDVPVRELQQTASASGFTDEPNEEAAAERARRAALILVRHHAFSKRVRSAYQHQCAMCGIGIDLVAGAHIFPARADSIYPRSYPAAAK